MCSSKPGVFALVATGIALCLMLFVTSDARGETSKKVDKDPQGASHTVGELLVTYKESQDLPTATEEMPKQVGANIREDIRKVDAQLLSFPSIKSEHSQKVREESLREKKAILEQDPRVETASYNYLRTASYIPDDPRFSSQHSLDKMKFPKAWNIARGQGVKIAILDDGFDASHPDLKNKINAQKDFVDDDSIAEDTVGGHGTHVAGIVAATTGNAEGIAGGCPQCGLIAGKVAQGGVGTVADLAEGVVWSADEGSKVINMSFGGYGSSDIEKDAVDYATSKGAVIIGAAGNYGSSEPFYPAAYPNVMAVAATDSGDQRFSLSNYGDWVTVSASGVHILSTIPNSEYGYKTGTSMDAPHVSALAGLLAGESLDGTTIRNRIESSAVDLGKKGKDPYYGYGRIDALAAVKGATTPKPRHCTINGTRGSDILRGTARPDIICGFGGSDIIRGGGGNDTIYGDAGNDILNGNSGSDRIIGGAGNDIVKDGVGLDRLYGGGGRDVLNVRDGRGGDLVDGGRDRDVCSADSRDKVARCP